MQPVLKEGFENGPCTDVWNVLSPSADSHREGVRVPTGTAYTPKGQAKSPPMTSHVTKAPSWEMPISRSDSGGAVICHALGETPCLPWGGGPHQYIFR